MSGLGTTPESWSAVAAMTWTMLAPGEHVQLQIAHGDQRSVRCRHGSVETCSHHRTSQGQASVWTDGCVGTANGPCGSADALARILHSARALALVPSEVPPVATSEAAECNLAVDDVLTAATTEAVAARARDILVLVADRSSVLVVETLMLVAETRELASWHVRGAPRLQRTARLSWAVSMMRKQARGATSLYEVIGCDDGWERGWSRLRTEIDGLAARLSATAPVRDLPSGRRVLLTPAAVADLVVPHLIMQRHAGGVTGSEMSSQLSLTAGPRTSGFFREQLTIDAGELEETQLRGEFGEVVCIGRFMGSVDPTSGRFSGVAKCSWLMTPGQPDAFVPDFGVSGDLCTLVASIGGLTASRELIRGEVLCPGILVEDGLDYGATTSERNVLPCP